MKTKIYEKNDFRKYFNKNQEFSEAVIPDYIRNSIYNTVVTRKSFRSKNNENQKQNLPFNNNNNQNNNNNNNPTRYFTFQNQTNQSEMNNYDTEKTEWNDRPAAYINTNPNNDITLNNSHQNNLGFSKFLEKKNVYDRLSELRESIGKRKINSPYLVLSNKQNNKKEFYDKIMPSSPNEYFVYSPKKILSLLSINCKESNHDNFNDSIVKNKKEEKSYFSSKTFYNINKSNEKSYKDLNNSTNNYFASNKSLLNNNFDNSFASNKLSEKKNEDDYINKSSIGLNLKSEYLKDDLSLKVKEPSKVNILYKIEQYKDYLRFKGV